MRADDIFYYKPDTLALTTAEPLNYPLVCASEPPA